MKFTFLFLALLSIACSSDNNNISTSISSEELKELVLTNKEKWDSLDINNYRYSLQDITYMSAWGDDIIPVIIYVSNNKVDSVFEDNSENDSTIVHGYQLGTEYAETIDDIFITMIQAIEEGYYQFSSSKGDSSLPVFDSEYYYPKSFYIDYYETENEYKENKKIASNKTIFDFKEIK